ncbi:MAG: C4-dicarboxylate ABC transporter [Rhodospirillaceae bacterium]|nr:C4-dicarboxylate ABC transporter [Rhodospirillaceae bacterium]
MYALAPTPEAPVTAENAAAPETAGSEAAAPAQQAGVRWRMGSAFASSLPILGTMGKRFEERISTVSNGNIRVQFFEPGALVPALELYDAVSEGSVDAGWSTAGYWAGKVPAAQFFTAVPFGPGLGEFLAWVYHGGGLELWQELYARNNIHVLPCNMISPEGSGWFREPIDDISQLQGLKMRFFGLGARVMEKLGVSTQLLAGGDIYPALELGTIDATEFSMPVIDEGLGFYEVAKNYYMPGWHQPTSINELMINMDRWNALTESQQATVEAVCGDNVRAGIAEAEASQFKALQDLQEKGVTLHRWPDEFLDRFRAAWEEVAQEEAAKDPDFKKVLDSLTEFRNNYKIWREDGYL